MKLDGLLSRPGIQIVWRSGRLILRIKPGALSEEEIEALRAVKPMLTGWLLLHELWAAGYEIKIEPSRYGPGFVLIPTGTARPGVGLESLFELYEAGHDEALRLLLDTCRRLGIEPTRWHDETPRRWGRLTRVAFSQQPEV